MTAIDPTPKTHRFAQAVAVFFSRCAAAFSFAHIGCCDPSLACPKSWRKCTLRIDICIYIKNWDVSKLSTSQGNIEHVNNGTTESSCQYVRSNFETSALGFLQLDEICPSVHYEFRYQFIMNISADKVKIRFCVSNAPGFSKRGKRSHHEKKKKACRRSMPVKMLSAAAPGRSVPW